MKIVIAAASGNIGRRTAEKVIQAGAQTVDIIEIALSNLPHR